MIGAMATKYEELAEQFEWHSAMAGSMRECADHHLLEAAGYKERMEDYTRELRSKGGGKEPKGSNATAPSCASKVAPVQAAKPKVQPPPANDEADRQPPNRPQDAPFENAEDDRKSPASNEIPELESVIDATFPNANDDIDMLFAEFELYQDESDSLPDMGPEPEPTLEELDTIDLGWIIKDSGTSERHWEGDGPAWFSPLR